MLKIRKAEEIDVAEMALLSQKAFSYEGAEFSLTEAEAWIHFWASSELGKGFMVETEGRVVGFIIWHEEDRYGSEVISRIINVVVDPDYRKRGIGKKLMQESLTILRQEYKNEAKDIYQIIAFLDEEKVIKFYQKAFSKKRIEVTELPHFWALGVKGWLVRVILRPRPKKNKKRG